jgi:hypothetical protein
VTRTLLNTFPTWLLALVTVGGAVALAVGGLRFTWRRFPELERQGVNDVVGVVIGVLAAVYGILLGFVTVALYQDFTDAKATVQEEATELIQIYEDSRAFPPATAAAVLTEVKSYIAAVRFSEWKRMRDGEADNRVGQKHVGDLYRVLRDYEPETNAQVAFYADAVARLNDVVDARRTRLDDAAEELPGAFRTILVAGAILLVASLYLLGIANRRVHTILVAAVAILTSFNLLIAIALDHPFSGDISVSSRPFAEERLAQLHVTTADLRDR